MPTYEYACSKCGHHFDKFQSMRDEPLKKCPKCHRAGLKRLIGGGAGLIFKGSGFYINDYRRKAEGKAGAAESKPAAEAKGATEPKPAAKAQEAGATKKPAAAGSTAS
jgi:putative FmdB family regulatory protein